MTDIYIDADACPVRDEVYRVAMRYNLSVYVVSNGSRPIRPVPNPAIKMITVGEGPDVADDWIAEHITAADICVTADIPLASRCLDKGARALAHNGKHWTTDNIGSALAGRESAGICASWVSRPAARQASRNPIDRASWWRSIPP